jgi:hypothetical protein
MEELAEWKFPGGGWLQIYQAPERAGSGSMTLAVSGLSSVTERLKGLGVELGERTSSSKVDTLSIVDPDGNRIALGEAFDETMAR